MDHLVALLYVVLREVLLLLAATKQGNLSFEVPHFLLEPGIDDAWVDRLVRFHVVLNHLDGTGEPTRAQ